MIKRVAIVGASGIVGRACLNQLMISGVRVIGFSRRKPDLPDAPHVSLDLMNAKSCREILADYPDISHVVYAALYEQPGLIAGWRATEQMSINLEMLDNFLTPLLGPASELQHVSLLQGTKAYGAHIRPMRIPGKEREPRVPHENFYWLQEDFLKSRQSGTSWRYTIWRPQIIFGHALGAPMNMLAAIGVYAAFCKADRKPLVYPGGASAPAEAIDADLLASAILFAMEHESCQNQTFNITNGDVFTWENVWPRIAESLGCDQGDPQSMRLVELYERESDWARIRYQAGLQNHSIRRLVGDSFHYADALLNTGSDRSPPPALLSTIKLRQAGFHKCGDTEDMLEKWFTRLTAMKILPSAGFSPS